MANLYPNVMSPLLLIWMRNCLVPLKMQKNDPKNFLRQNKWFFSKKPIKTHFGWAFYSFLVWVFFSRVLWVGFLCQPQLTAFNRYRRDLSNEVGCCLKWKLKDLTSSRNLKVLSSTAIKGVDIFFLYHRYLMKHNFYDVILNIYQGICIYCIIYTLWNK